MKLYITATILIMGMLLSACTMTGQVTQTPDTITIGYAGPLSGGGAVWGQNMKKGFDYGLEQINDSRIRVVYEDTQCDAKIGLTAFQKLIVNDDATIITGTACSSVAHAVAPLVEEHDIFYIASGATQPDVPQLGEHIFRLWVSDDYEARALAREAARLGMTKVAIMYVNDNPAGVSIKDGFVDEANKLGVQVVSQESYSSTEQDFRAQLTKMSAQQPQAVYIMASGEQIATVINQARALGFEKTIFAYAPSLVAEGVGAKIIDSSNIVYALPKEVKATSFWSEYKEQTGEDADLLVALGYDSAMMVKEALDACNTDTDCMSDFFIQRGTISTSRGVLEFDDEGDLAEVPFEILSY